MGVLRKKLSEFEGGSRGLVIVVSLFFMQLLLLGTSSSTGVFTVALIDFFHGDVVGVSYLMAIFYACFFGTGPIVSFLNTWLSLRKSTFLGSTMVVVGLISASFSPNLACLYVSFGVFAGIGCSFVFFPAFTIVSQSFNRCRTLAIGLVTAGCGLGGITLPVLLEFLIETYTWRGAMLILAGLHLHLFVMASLLSISAPSKQEIDIVLRQRKNQLDNDGQKEDTVFEHNDRTISGGSELQEQQDLKAAQHDSSDGNCVHDTSADDLSASMQLLNKEGHDADSGTTDPSNTRSHSEKQSFENNSTQQPDETAFWHFKRALQKHTRVFRYIDFDLLVVCGFIYAANSTTFFSFGTELVVELGHSSATAAFFFMFVGAGSFTGSVMLSVVNNLLGNSILTYILAITCFGAGLLCLPFANGHALFIFIHMLMGVSMGLINALFLVLITQFVGVENTVSGIGYFMFSEGLGCFAGPSVVGHLREFYGSYKIPFVTCGVVIFFAAAIKVPKCISTFRKTKKCGVERTDRIPD